MNTIISKIKKLAEMSVAAMLAVMFFTFIVQITMRYLFEPIGWTVELITVLWIWVIFIGNAFVVRGKDHVTFDILYLIAPNKIQRVMAFISALVVAGVFLWSFAPTYNYYDFLAIKKTPLLKIPYNNLFFCFIVFLVAAIIQSLGKAASAVQNTLPETPNEILLSSEDGKDADEDGDEIQDQIEDELGIDTDDDNTKSEQ